MRNLKGQFIKGIKSEFAGKTHSVMSKIKIGLTSKGRIPTQKQLEALSLGGIARKGQRLSDETKKKISKSKTGFKMSKETKIKMSKQKNSLRGKQACSKAGELGSLKRWMGHIKNPNRQPRIRKTVMELLEKKRFRNQRYKARKRNALGSHTFEEWLLLKTYCQNMCLCCKRQEPEIKLTEDHIIPLDKGGSDYIDNIQPLCLSCNCRKHTKTIYYRPVGNEFLLPKLWAERSVNNKICL